MLWKTNHMSGGRVRGRDQPGATHQHTEVLPTGAESDVIITAFITILYQL